MAAHAVAAAHCSLGRCYVWLLVYVLICVPYSSCRTNKIYSRDDLLTIGARYELDVTADFQRLFNIPGDIARSPGAPWITIAAGRKRRRRRERRQKRGCRAGVLARLRRQPHKPPLPSLFLSNARSLANKMDELRLQAASHSAVKDSCILLITETWLHPDVADSAIELAGYTVQRHDRTKDSTDGGRQRVLAAEEVAFWVMAPMRGRQDELW
ncbi:uncharacterized protein LOC116720089 [Xiphophorus hellerii]|uniref:uncharacterized protein LOC116720089 n=1 Tax=Xiphophorus hellerii TaxID=8084 RepID=UPI0013B47667|nr:uncharacterized protein LOC116720089 [Xiphophorus hellerii]